MGIYTRVRAFLWLGLGLFNVCALNALDLNNNGMSDVWERVYNVTNPTLDEDGDGQTNLKEAQAGTNPHDSTDYFKTFNFSSADFTTVSISWRSVEERYYEIEQSTDLVTWNYSAYVYGETEQATTSTVFEIGAPGSSKIFFRVRGYPEYDYDYDNDSLSAWEERLLGTFRNRSV
jgi:hypothetical protein